MSPYQEMAVPFLAGLIVEVFVTDRVLEPRQLAQGVLRCLLERPASVSAKRGWVSPGLVPLAELRLENVVDIDPDAADAALVDLDLMQMRGGMCTAAR